MACKYCGDENYGWCCPACFEDFEAEGCCGDDDGSSCCGDDDSWEDGE